MPVFKILQEKLCHGLQGQDRVQVCEDSGADTGEEMELDFKPKVSLYYG